MVSKLLNRYKFLFRNHLGCLSKIRKKSHRSFIISIYTSFMYNFTDHCWLTSIAKVVLRTFQLKFTLFLHQYIVMENRISVIIDQWTKKKLMKNNLPASSPNRASNIPTNANISIAVHKDLSGHVAGFLAFTFLDVPFHCERCRQVLIVYRRKASNVYGVSNKRL